MKRFIKAVVMLMACLAFAKEAQAGAWVHKRGAGYYELKFYFIRAQRYFEPDGRIITIPTVGEYTTSFYGEHGLSERVTLVGEFPVYKRITLNRRVGRNTGFEYFPGDAASGLADAEIGVRYGLLRGGATVLSASVRFGLPLGDHTQTNGLLTGDGEFNQTFALQLGHSFYPLPAYCSSEVGVNQRTHGYSDEVRYELELGYSLTRALTLNLKMNGLEPLRNGDNNMRGGTGGLYANNQRYLAFGPGVFYNLYKNYGLNTRVAFAAYGERVLAAPQFFFGIFYKS